MYMDLKVKIQLLAALQLHSIFSLKKGRKDQMVLAVLEPINLDMLPYFLRFLI